MKTVANLNWDSFDENNLQIYPNPAKDAFTVSLNALDNNKVAISMFDLKGHKIYQKKLDEIKNQKLDYKIELEDINSNTVKGYYLVHIDLGEKSGTYPLIVQ